MPGMVPTFARVSSAPPSALVLVSCHEEDRHRLPKILRAVLRVARAVPRASLHRESGLLAPRVLELLHRLHGHPAPPRRGEAGGEAGIGELLHGVRQREVLTRLRERREAVEELLPAGKEPSLHADARSAGRAHHGRAAERPGELEDARVLCAHAHRGLWQPHEGFPGEVHQDADIGPLQLRSESAHVGDDGLVEDVVCRRYEDAGGVRLV
mmetsp:Transcript_50745/g.157150  ORF Transcript_50745/g.157150 Transcript_50745/m.157150 type:complete len:211 (+) Transcript_50745:42-674(+)